MHLILTGATGLVGTAILHHVLSLPSNTPIAQQISRLSILTRRAGVPLLEHPNRPTANTHTKIEIIRCTDFKDYTTNGVLAALRSNSDDEKIGVIWALGVSQTVVKDEQAYDEITRVYPEAAAKALCENLGAKQVNFVYVSGEGATSRPGRFTQLFGRVKGRTERELTDMMKQASCSQTLKVYNVRPGGVDSGAEESQKLVHELTHVEDGGTGGQTRNGYGFKAAEAIMMPLLRAGVYKSMHSPTAELARVLVDLVVGNGEPINEQGVEAGGRTLPNAVLRRLAKPKLQSSALTPQD